MIRPCQAGGTVAVVLRDPGARKRVLAMRRTFTQYADHLTGIALVARKPRDPGTSLV